MSMDLIVTRSLASIKRDYLVQADALAEQARLKVLTPGSGQSLTYDAKYAEALAYINGTASETPWIDAEAEALESTRDAVAQSILEARESWSVVGIWIEAARLKAKRAIEQAATAAEVHHIVDGLRVTLG